MKKRKKLFISITVILAALALFIIALPKLGSCLVVKDEPQPVDIIVVLMGNWPERMLGAVDLYQAGYAGEIVMVRNMLKGYDLAVRRGIKLPHDTDIAREVAVQSGVPAQKVIILPGDAESTQAEALQEREYLQRQQDIDSLIVVTSKSHSMRAKKIFVKAMSSLEREVRVISCPTQYDDFNAVGWWQSRDELKQVVLEYLKLVHFYLWEQFQLD